MSLKKLWPYSFLFLFLLFYFYKTFFKALVPIPANLLVSWFYPWNSLPGFGVPYKGIIAMDAVRQMLPWRSLYASYFLPFWNPYNFAGQPLMANFQSAFFYPLTWFYLFLKTNFAWTINLLLTVFLGMLFMYYYLIRLGLKKAAALLGAMAFVSCSFFVKWLEFVVVDSSLIFLPLSLLAIEIFLQDKNKKALIFLALSLVFSIFGGHIQTAFYVWFFSFIYAFWRIFSQKNKKLKKENIVLLSVTFFLSFFMAGIQLFPSWELYQLLARDSVTNLDKYHNYLMPVKYLITQFVPDFFGNEGAGNFWGKEGSFNIYIGIVALFFIPLAWLNKKQKRLSSFLLVVAFFSLILASPNFISYALQKMQLPLISSSDPSRILLLWQISFLTLAVIGFNNLLINKIKINKLLIYTLPAFLFYIALNLFFNFYSQFGNSQEILANLRVIKRNLILPSLIYFLTLALSLFYLKKEKWQKFLVFLFLFLALGEYYYAVNKFLPFSEKKHIFPKTNLVNFIKQNSVNLERFSGTKTAALEKNFATYFQIYSPEGYDPLFPARYGELITYAKEGKLIEDITRSDVDMPINIDNVKTQKLLDLLGVKYITFKELNPELIGGHNTLFSKNIYNKVWESSANQIYENKQALPRFYLLGGVEKIREKDKILKRLFDSDLDFKNKLIIEEDPPNWFKITNDYFKKVELVENSPNKMVFLSNSSNSAVFFTSDVYYPGWQVKVDGKEDKIYRANYIFRAVFLPAGDHKIEFKYLPSNFYLYLMLSGISFLVLIKLAYGFFKKQK